jgi:hypothetical protein
MIIRICKVCAIEKSLDLFEITTKDGKCRRAVCKPCYSKEKKERAKTGSATVDRNSIPKPTMCDKCGKGPGEVDFKWRTDVKQGGWRKMCNICFNENKYYEDYREREKSKDLEGYLKHNAEVHLKWAKQNPGKIKEQQVKTATVPERKIK